MPLAVTSEASTLPYRVTPDCAKAEPQVIVATTVVASSVLFIANSPVVDRNPTSLARCGFARGWGDQRGVGGGLWGLKGGLGNEGGMTAPSIAQLFPKHGGTNLCRAVAVKMSLKLLWGKITIPALRTCKSFHCAFGRKYFEPYPLR